MLGNSACFLSSVDFFFKITFFQRNLLGIPSVCQSVWIQIRPDILSGLICVQTVCKRYQQTTKVTTSRKRVDIISKSCLFVVVFFVLFCISIFFFYFLLFFFNFHFPSVQSLYSIQLQHYQPLMGMDKLSG